MRERLSTVGAIADATPVRTNGHPDSAVTRRPLRLLIVADNEQRAGFLQRAFAHHFERIDIALTGHEGQRLLHSASPEIAIIGAEAWDATVDRTLQELKGHGSARLVVVITTDRRALTSIETLRKGPDGYVRATAITLGRDETSNSLPDWVASTLATLCFQCSAP